MDTDYVPSEQILLLKLNVMKENEVRRDKSSACIHAGISWDTYSKQSESHGGFVWL